MARQGIFFIPLVWLLSSRLGLTGIQITQTVADVFTMIFAIPIQLKVLKELSVPDGTPLS
jgi:Na+-driven multidrug efflux pump